MSVLRYKSLELLFVSIGGAASAPFLHSLECSERSCALAPFFWLIPAGFIYFSIFTLYVVVSSIAYHFISRLGRLSAPLMAVLSAGYVWFTYHFLFAESLDTRLLATAVVAVSALIAALLDTEYQRRKH